MFKVHKGPLAYAEAFLEPNKFNKNYPKELKRKFKTTFKRLIDSYQRGIDLYQQLAIKANQTSEEAAATTTTTTTTNMTTIAIASVISKNTSSLINSSVLNSSSSQSGGQNNAPTSSLKYYEMSRILQEKFNELENSFRNLLLIDGVSGIE